MGERERGRDGGEDKREKGREGERDVRGIREEVRGG